MSKMSPLKAIIFIVFLSLMDLEVADARTKLPSLREAIEMVFGLREPTSNLRSGTSSHPLFKLKAIEGLNLTKSVFFNALEVDGNTPPNELLENVLKFFKSGGLGNGQSIWDQVEEKLFDELSTEVSSILEEKSATLDSVLEDLLELYKEAPEEYKDALKQTSEYFLEFLLAFDPSNPDHASFYDPSINTFWTKLSAYFFTVASLDKNIAQSKEVREYQERRTELFWNGIADSIVDTYKLALDKREGKIMHAMCSVPCNKTGKRQTCEIHCSEDSVSGETSEEAWLELEVNSTCVKVNTGVYAVLAFQLRRHAGSTLTKILSPVKSFLKESNRTLIKIRADNRKYPITTFGQPCDSPCILDGETFHCGVHEELETCSPIDHAGGKYMTTFGKVCEGKCERDEETNEYWCEVAIGRQPCSPFKAENYKSLPREHNDSASNEQQCEGFEVNVNDRLLKTYSSEYV